MNTGRRLAAVLVVAGIVLTGFTAVKRQAAESELAQLTADLQAVTVEKAAAAQDVARLSGLAVALYTESAVLTALADERADFVDAVGEMKAALAAAEGKVDAAAEREAVVAAQERVLEERVDPSVVDDATDEVTDVAATVIAAVEAHDEEQRRLAAEAAARARSVGSAGGGARVGAAGGGGGGSGGSLFARVRAALDAVGGGGVGLQQSDGSCGGGYAAACASSAGYIKFSPAIGSFSDGQLRWAMAHELAHIRQFAVWGALMASSGYASLYGGDIELLANCMAAVRGYPSGANCGGGRWDFAAAIWNGYVP